MDIFPSWRKFCTEYFTHKKDNCHTGLFDMWEMGKIKGFKLNPDTLNKIFDAFGFNEDAERMREWSYD